jgi:hypothetical protein
MLGVVSHKKTHIGSGSGAKTAERKGITLTPEIVGAKLAFSEVSSRMGSMSKINHLGKVMHKST